MRGWTRRLAGRAIAARCRRKKQADQADIDMDDGTECELDRKCGLMRCTVHVHRNLLAPASERLHEEVPADYNDMVYTVTPKEIETRRRRVQGRRGALLFPAVVWRRGPREVHGE